VAAVDYPKPLTPIWRSRFRRNRLSGERRINQIANRPNAISNAKRHRWRAAQSLMHAAEIVERDVQRDGGKLDQHYPRFGGQYRLPLPYEPDQDDDKGM
jgi:hypothetical protein